MFRQTPKRYYIRTIATVLCCLFLCSMGFAQREGNETFGPSIMTQIATFEAAVEQFVLVPITAHDGGAGRDAIRFSAINLPPGLSIHQDFGTISGYIERNRTTINGGVFTSIVQVANKTDRRLTDSKTITWNIRPPNSPGEKDAAGIINLNCDGIPVGNGFGSHDIYISGGTPPYTVVWTSPSGETTTTQVLNPSDLPNTGSPTYPGSNDTDEIGTHTVMVTDANGNTASCESYVSKAINVCAGSCFTLGEDLPQDSGYCYKWEAKGNAVNTNQTPDSIEEESENTAKVCPTYPQYYCVLVTDGLNVIATEQYYLETNSSRHIDSKPSLQVTIETSGKVCSDPLQVADLMAVVSGNGNYKYEWSTGDMGSSTQATDIRIYTVSVEDSENKECKGFGSITPPVCEEDLNVATFELKKCAVANLKPSSLNSLGDSADGSTPGLKSFVDPSGIDNLIQYINQEQQSGDGTNRQYIVSSAEDCPLDAGDTPCPAQVAFDEAEDYDVLYWIQFRADGTAQLKVKYADDFFEGQGLSSEQQASMKATFLAKLRENFDCEDKILDNLHKVNPADADEVEPEPSEACKDESNPDRCEACIERCLSFAGLGLTRPIFGVREDRFTACKENFLSVTQTDENLWKSFSKDLKIPKEMWMYDGNSLYYMHPGLAGILEAIIQENIVGGVYQLGQVLFNEKLRTALGEALENPWEALKSLKENAPKLLEAIVKEFDQLDAMSCAYPPHSCDDMLFAWGKIVGFIGMNFTGANFIDNIVTDGLGVVLGQLDDFTTWLNKLDGPIRDAFNTKLDEVFEGSEALLKQFWDDFKGNPGLLQKFADNPVLLNAWKILQDLGRTNLKKDIPTLNSIAKLFSNQNLLKFLMNLDPPVSMEVFLKEYITRHAQAGGFSNGTNKAVLALIDDLGNFDWFMKNYGILDNNGNFIFDEFGTFLGYPPPCFNGLLCGAASFVGNSFVIQFLKNNQSLGGVHSFEGLIPPIPGSGKMYDIRINVTDPNHPTGRMFIEAKNFGSFDSFLSGGGLGQLQAYFKVGSISHIAELKFVFNSRAGTLEELKEFFKTSVFSDNTYRDLIAENLTLRDSLGLPPESAGPAAFNAAWNNLVNDTNSLLYSFLEVNP